MAGNEKVQKQHPTDSHTWRHLGCGCVSAMGQTEDLCLASVSSHRAGAIRVGKKESTYPTPLRCLPILLKYVPTMSGIFLTQPSSNPWNHPALSPFPSLVSMTHVALQSAGQFIISLNNARSVCSFHLSHADPAAWYEFLALVPPVMCTCYNPTQTSVSS